MGGENAFLYDRSVFHLSKSEANKLWFLPNPMKEKKDHTISFSLCQIQKKKDELLSANEDMLSIQSGFTDAVECSRQQILQIKCKIKSQMLSANTQYACYLVFKLSEKCCGLHGPVIVRDLFNWRSKETGILYFRHPNPWNVLDTDWVPRQRKDGWRLLCGNSTQIMSLKMIIFLLI
ncbi:putative phloem protein [Helianthus annuus]|nr:putative phloem protein [Helianthus annuus]